MLAAAAAAATAQPPLWTAPGQQPRPAPADARPPAPAPVPTRVVLFQKPAEGKVQPPADAGKAGQQAPAPEKPAEAPKQPTAGTSPGNRPRIEVARLQNDEELDRRLIQELMQEERERNKGNKDWVLNPKYFAAPPVEQLVPPGTPYVTKAVREAYPPARSVLEPDYVVHRRLYFEEKNAERYGWDLGFAQPFVSALYFYKDALFWPAKLASHPFERYDTSAGKCLPGSPVPYYWYPPEIDLWGVAAEAGIVTGAAIILP